MLTVTKRFEFAYAHHLPDYDGLCARQHGHNAGVEVEVARRESVNGAEIIAASTYPGMIIDFKDLKAVVKTVLNEYDHRYLNELIDFAVATPTAENMTASLVDKIQTALAVYGVELVRLRVSETTDSWAEWRRE